MGKNEHLPLTLCTKMTLDLSMKAKTLKLLEKNTRGSRDLRADKNFLSRAQKALTMTEVHICIRLDDSPYI